MRLDTIAVLALLAAAVAWSLFRSHALLALDGQTLAIMGALMVALSLALGRWAGGPA